MRSLFLGLFILCSSAVAALAFRPIAADDGSNLALSGYDVVAYHTEGRAVAGRPVFQTTWQGVEWRFYRRTHMEMFQEEPERFVPEFGGYCAFGLSEHKVAHCDPEAFIFVEGRLYVLSDEARLEAWRESPDERVAEAEAYWAELLSTEDETGGASETAFRRF